MTSRHTIVRRVNLPGRGSLRRRKLVASARSNATRSRYSLTAIAMGAAGDRRAVRTLLRHVSIAQRLSFQAASESKPRPLDVRADLVRVDLRRDVLSGFRRRAGSQCILANSL